MSNITNIQQFLNSIHYSIQQFSNSIPEFKKYNFFARHHKKYKYNFRQL